ncbi:MAG: cobalamin-binding protein [Treponemataceae bacterium]
MKKKFFICAIFFLLPSFFFAQQYNRIVSLSPAITEILFFLRVGDKIIARTDFCDYPAAAKNIASVGGFDGKSFSIEKILSFNPDIVFLVKDMHDFLVPVLKKLGVVTYLVSTVTLNDVLNEIESIGMILNTEERATSVVNALKAKIDQFRKKNRKLKSVNVYFEIFDRPQTTIGGISFISELINIAGAKNIFSDLDIAYPVVSTEAILSRKPDVILISSDMQTSVNDVKTRENWEDVPAVQNNNIYKVDANIFLRPSPRFVSALESLDKILSNIRADKKS